MASKFPNITPGEVVPGGFTYPNNAQVVGDDLYIRDGNGNQISGRQVDNGDKITVLDVSHSRQLALVQYPAGSVVRQGYVTNATSLIKYFEQGKWKNGSTPEPVYDEDDNQIGSLDPYETATPIYKAGGKTHVVYNTSKGPNTKSGFVAYEGTTGGSTSSDTTNGVAPGEVVPGGFSYPNNAQVVGDDLYIRDGNGNQISGRQVDNGDHITVLDVSYSRQLALVQYPAGSVVRQGYVKNIPSLIKYYNQGQWHNGSTVEPVLDENRNPLGSLDPYESATPLYKKNGMIHVVYNTDKGPNTKSGYVDYEGSSPTTATIPTPSATGAERIVYGKSGMDKDLVAYKIGNGNNSLVLVCAVHGWEDHWPADGIELVKIGNSVIEHFANNVPSDFSLYVIPAANPDGLSKGYTNNGPGRCTIVGGIDINRDFPVGFISSNGDPRNRTAANYLSVNESRNLHGYLKDIKNRTSGKMIVIDLHGWEGAAIGNSEIGQYFRNQFGFEQRSGYGEGYLIAWANKELGAKSALIELPTNTYSHNDVVNGGYAQKVINALSNILVSVKPVKNGWIMEDNRWRYYNNGARVFGWITDKGSKYYLDSNGYMVTGEYMIDDIKYIFSNSGELISIVDDKTNDPAPDIPGFQSLDEINNSIRNILTKHFGFSASLDINKPIALLMTPNATIEAFVGTTHTFSKPADQFNLAITNNNLSIETGDALLPIKFAADYREKLKGFAASIKFGIVSLKLNIDGSIEIKISMKTNVAAVVDKVKYLKIKITPNKNVDSRITNELLQSSFEESQKYLPYPSNNEYKIMLNLKLYLIFTLTLLTAAGKTIYNIYKAFKLAR